MKRGKRIFDLSLQDFERMERAAFDAAFRQSRWDQEDDPEFPSDCDCEHCFPTDPEDIPF